MENGKVMTTAGTFHIRRPSLAGWRRILGCLAAEHMNALIDAVVELFQAPDTPEPLPPPDPDAEQAPELPDEAYRQRVREAQAEAFRTAGRKLLPVMAELPIAAATLARECLAGEDGKPALTEEEAPELLDDTDFDAVLDALKTTGILKDLADRLKKRLGGRMAETADVPGSART